MRASLQLAVLGLISASTAGAQTVQISAAAFTNVANEAALGSTQRSVSAPIGTSLTAGLVQSVALPTVGGGPGLVAESYTAMWNAGSPDTGWTYTIDERGMAAPAASGAGATARSGPHAVLVRLLAPAATTGELILEYEPRNVPTNGLIATSIDIGNDGTVEFAAAGGQPVVARSSTTIGPAGLLLLMGTAGSAVAGTATDRFDFTLRASFAPVSTCTIAEVGPACGPTGSQPGLQPAQTFSDRIAFRLQNLPGPSNGLSYLVLGLLPETQVLPLAPGCTRFTSLDASIPLLPNSIGSQELVFDIPLIRPYVVYAQAATLTLSTRTIWTTRGWMIQCP